MTQHFQLNVRVPDGAPFRVLTAQSDGMTIHSVHYIPTHSSEKADGIRPQSEVIDELERLLNAYLSSTPEDLASKPVRFDRLSPHLGQAPNKFEDDVRKAVINIPCGSVLAYGEVAEKIGYSREEAVRVGEACGSNPFGIVVPVFRVIRAGFRLGDFHRGHAHTSENPKQDKKDKKTWREIKRWFLQHEGCQVDGANYGSQVIPRHR